MTVGDAVVGILAVAGITAVILGIAFVVDDFFREKGK